MLHFLKSNLGHNLQTHRYCLLVPYSTVGLLVTYSTVGLLAGVLYCKSSLGLVSLRPSQPGNIKLSSEATVTSSVIGWSSPGHWRGRLSLTSWSSYMSSTACVCVCCNPTLWPSCDVKLFSPAFTPTSSFQRTYDK